MRILFQFVVQMQLVETVVIASYSLKIYEYI